MPLSLRKSPATRQLLWLVGQIGLVIFVVEALLMIFLIEPLLMSALSGHNLVLGYVLVALLDAASLTLISSPIVYFWIVRPFVLSAWDANEAVTRTAHALQDALQEKQAQAVRLVDALSRLKVQTAAVDRLAIISETDARGVITQVNDTFCLTSGYTRQELVGRTHALINSGLHPKSFWKDMYATLAKGDVWQGEVRNRAKDGSYYWVRSANVAVRDADGKLSGYLSLRLDITENKTQQEELKQQGHKLDAQKVQLDTALNNMARGLSMFDTQARLIVCNRIYRQIYGLPEELTQPGTPLADIIRYYVKTETGRDSKEDIETQRKWIKNHVAALAGGKSFSHVQHLKDGRTILVSNQPLPNGGWVDLQEDITEKRRFEAKIEHMAHHDALTGLPNRVRLGERLGQALTRVRRGDKLAFHLLDLDRFKTVNDTLGHPIGDDLLKAVAQRLRRILRETETIARMGGDEFAIVQVGIEKEEAVTSFAQRVIDVISEPYDLGEHHIVVGASIGIALAPADGDTAEQLIKSADLALYQAKKQGRGTYSFFEKELDARMQARHTLEADLRKGVAAGEFELHYQPLVNLEQYQIAGLEGLMRWRHPERGMILPGEFVPVAEEIGLIAPLGEWAITQACAAAATWPDRIKVAVNISPVQFKRPGLVDVVVSALAASGLPAGRLELEIMESVLLENIEANLGTLHQLRALGVRIALDDFGTGYSSLSYLQSFPFDKIKIDHSFIKDITVMSGSIAIVKAVVMLARGLGMTATAEGIENKEQLDVVRSLGCAEAQGNFFSPPRPAREIERLYLPRGEVGRIAPSGGARQKSARRRSAI